MNKEKINEKVNKSYTLPSWILSNYGTIKEVKDGVVIVKEGLNKVGMSEMVEFEKSRLKGIVNYLYNFISFKVCDLVKIRFGFLKSLLYNPKKYKNIKRYYFLKKVKNNKWEQLKMNLKFLNGEIKQFENTKLKRKKYFVKIFGLSGFISLYFGNFFSYLGPYIYLIAFFDFFISFVLFYYVIYKKLQFIYKVDLNCNTKFFVKGVAYITQLFGPITSGIITTTGIGFGGLLSANWFIENLRGVNVIEEIGRDYVDGDLSVVETKDKIIEKIKKGYKDKTKN